jgi:hypothetical protein
MFMKFHICEFLENLLRKFKIRYATALFPCGVRRVASLLLSKLGLDHRVIYVGDP